MQMESTKLVSVSLVELHHSRGCVVSLCVGNVVASRVKIKLEWRMGSAQIDWDAIAKKEHLEQVDAYMERFKSTIRQLSDELKEIRRKEQDMRKITGTAPHTLHFSCLSLQRQRIHVWLCLVCCV